MGRVGRLDRWIDKYAGWVFFGYLPVCGVALFCAYDTRFEPVVQFAIAAPLVIFVAILALGILLVILVVLKDALGFNASDVPPKDGSTWKNEDEWREFRYGEVHQMERARWADIIATDGAECAERTCIMPTRTIRPGARWHLAHDHLARENSYLGPAHPRCNEFEALARGVTWAGHRELSDREVYDLCRVHDEYPPAPPPGTYDCRVVDFHSRTTGSRSYVVIAHEVVHDCLAGKGTMIDQWVPGENGVFFGLPLAEIESRLRLASGGDALKDLVGTFARIDLRYPDGRFDGPPYDGLQVRVVAAGPTRDNLHDL